MSVSGATPAPFALLRPPYDLLEPLAIDDLSSMPVRGAAVVWDLVDGIEAAALEAASSRPRGLALMVMMPPVEKLDSHLPVFEIIESCQPHSILPHHPRHRAEEWGQLLRRFPPDLPADVVEYLVWSGVRIDSDSRHLVRRILELSAELRTVSALARALYVSRRALGRRLLRRGLPVPSHWLHFGRVLRAALKLQSTKANLFSVACSLGYPDGFSLSNQMYRLTGVRPTDARASRGWEWLVEAWMERERAGSASAESHSEGPAPAEVASEGSLLGGQTEEALRPQGATPSHSDIDPAARPASP